MFQEKLREWLVDDANGTPESVSQSQFSVLIKFAAWLDRDAELHVHPTTEQNGALFWGCSNCEAGNSAVNSVCANCKVPRSNRSAVE